MNRQRRAYADRETETRHLHNTHSRGEREAPAAGAAPVGARCTRARENNISILREQRIFRFIRRNILLVYLSREDITEVCLSETLSVSFAGGSRAILYYYYYYYFRANERLSLNTGYEYDRRTSNDVRR